MLRSSFQHFTYVLQIGHDYGIEQHLAHQLAQRQLHLPRRTLLSPRPPANLIYGGVPVSRQSDHSLGRGLSPLTFQQLHGYCQDESWKLQGQDPANINVPSADLEDPLPHISRTSKFEKANRLRCRLCQRARMSASANGSWCLPAFRKRAKANAAASKIAVRGSSLIQGLRSGGT
jgi:hypothetical protein